MSQPELLVRGSTLTSTRTTLAVRMQCAITRMTGEPQEEAKEVAEAEAEVEVITQVIAVQVPGEVGAG